MTAAPRVYLDLLKRHGRELSLSRLSADRVRQRPRRQHRARPSRPCSSCGRSIASGATCCCSRRPTGRSAPSRSEADQSLVQSRMGHACEWETSMMLRIAPAPGRRLQAGHSRAALGDPFEPANRGWITKDRTEPGHIGDPAACHGRKRRDAVPHVCRRRRRVSRARDRWDGKSSCGSASEGDMPRARHHDPPATPVTTTSPPPAATSFSPPRFSAGCSPAFRWP